MYLDVAAPSQPGGHHAASSAHHACCPVVERAGYSIRQLPAFEKPPDFAEPKQPCVGHVVAGAAWLQPPWSLQTVLVLCTSLHVLAVDVHTSASIRL